MCRAILLIALASACSSSTRAPVRDPEVAEIAVPRYDGQAEVDQQEVAGSTLDHRARDGAEHAGREKTLLGDRRESGRRALGREVRQALGAGEQDRQVGARTTRPVTYDAPLRSPELDHAAEQGLIEAGEWTRLMPRIREVCGRGIHLEPGQPARFVITSSAGNVPVAHADSLGVASCASAEFSRIVEDEQSRQGLGRDSAPGGAQCNTSCAGDRCRVCCTSDGLTSCRV